MTKKLLFSLGCLKDSISRYQAVMDIIDQIELTSEEYKTISSIISAKIEARQAKIQEIKSGGREL